jgi:hypothetical protein
MVTTATAPAETCSEIDAIFINDFVKECIKADYSSIEMFLAGGVAWLPASVMRQAYDLGFVACVRAGSGAGAGHTHVDVVTFLMSWWWNEIGLANTFPVVPLEAIMESLTSGNEDMIRYLIGNSDPVVYRTLNNMYERARSKYMRHPDVVAMARIRGHH